MTCGRCSVEDRPDRFVLRLVDLEAEAQEDGRRHEGRVYDRDWRCRDREACAERARQEAAS